MDLWNDYFLKWRDHLKESCLHENVLAAEDIGWLTDFMFRNHRRTTIKDSGTILFLLDQPRYQAINERFESLFRRLVPDYDDCFFDGNFYMARHPYNIHTDCGMPEHMQQFDHTIMPYRQLIIPLICTPSKRADLRAGVVTFKQRHLNFGTIFCQGFEEQVKGSWTDIHDHSNCTFYTLDGTLAPYDPRPFDAEFRARWLDHYPEDNLRGLDVEHHFPFRPGSIIEIDACQLHGVVNFPRYNITNRAGLAFNLFKRLA